MRSWRTMLIAVLILSAAFFAADLKAQGEISSENGTFALICRKLGRGIANTGFGALELPIKIMEVNFEEGGIPACTYGVFLGIGHVLAREFVGIAEILTFYLPLPGCPMNPNETGWGYGPIIRPEWIITPETNAFNIFYPSSRTMEI